MLFTRRDFLKLSFALGGTLALPYHWSALAQTGQTSTTVDIRARLGRPLDHNVLKLFRAVADPTTNRVYVSGILTPHIGVWDDEAGEWIGTVDSGFSGSALRYLALDPAAQRLYVRHAAANQLNAIDVVTDQVIATANVPAVFGDMIADAERGLLYIVAGEGAGDMGPGLHALDSATLDVVFSNSEMGPGVNRMAHDGDILYLLDGMQSGPAGRIYRFDLTAQTIAGQIEFALPPSARPVRLEWDTTTARFFVMTPRQGIFVLDPDGNEQHNIPLLDEWTYEDMVFNPASETLMVLMTERPSGGRAAGVQGRAIAYNPDSGQPMTELDFGRKVHSVALNPTSGRVFCPNGDASVLWRVDAAADEVTSLRLGDSLEQVVPVRGGSLLIMNSRLGGNYLVAYNVDSDTMETFEAGTWPIPVRTDLAGETLYVLNAWDSTLSIFDVRTGIDLVDTIDIGLPPGTTDRLPDLAIDTDNGLAFAAYPEHAQIAVIDLNRKERLTTIFLDGVERGADVGGGPGEVQVLANPEKRALFVYLHRQRQMRTFSYDWSLLGSNTIPGRRGTESAFNLLHLDAEKNRLFVGSLVFDAVRGNPTGQQLARGQRIFAMDETTYWVSDVEQRGDDRVRVVVVIDRDSLAEVAAYELGVLEAGIEPEYAYDPARQQFYEAHMTEAVLNIYPVE